MEKREGKPVINKLEKNIALFQEEYKKEKCKGNLIRLAHSKISLYSALVEETRKELDNYDEQFEISLSDLRKWVLNLSKYQEHKKLKQEKRNELIKYQTELDKAQQDYDNLFSYNLNGVRA
ncbi:MAG: hypothetical protein WC438_00585 [Candidatus Pacearchaeota archaeon]